MAESRITSVAAEALVLPPANGRLSLVAAEALVVPPANARVSLLYVEVLRSVASVTVTANRRRCMMIS